MAERSLNCETGGLLAAGKTNNNLLLTEHKGHTGEYWPEVMAVWTKRSEVRTKLTEGQYSPARLEQARLVSSLYGTWVMLVLKLPAFENKKYISYDHFETVRMAKSQPRNNQSERSDLPQDYLAI